MRLQGWRHEGAIEEAGRQVFDNSRGHPELVFGFLQVLEDNRPRPRVLARVDHATPRRRDPLGAVVYLIWAGFFRFIGS